MSSDPNSLSPDRPEAETGEDRRKPLPPADPMDELCEARPVPPAEKAMVQAASMVLAVIILLGAALAVQDKNPFWFLVALWALALVLATAFRGWTDCAPPREYLALATLPFVAATICAHFGTEPFPMEQLGFKLLYSVALFALCLATSAYLGTYTTMRLNRQFVVSLSFVLYVAVLTIRGPIGFYGDMAFQTSHILSNDSFMADFIFGCFIGVIMSWMVNRHLRRGSALGASASPKGEVSP